MRIAKYIADLLYNYECVVIPDFGGFITNEVSSQVSPVQHVFTPPAKKIVFNVHLRTNDGLLINHIATSEKISYLDARIRVETFVRKCKTALDIGKRIRMHNIGVLFREGRDEVVFEPDTSRNYMADSFGLSSFISPPVKREPVIRQDKKFQDRKTTLRPAEVRKKAVKKGPKYIHINLFTILIITGIFAFGYFYYGRIVQWYGNYSSLIPFFYNNAGEYYVENLDKLPVKVVNRPSRTNNESQISTEKTTVNPEKETEEMTITGEQAEDGGAETFAIEQQVEEATIDIPVKKETPVVVKPAVTNQNPPKPEIYIIAGSFENHENAVKMVARLRAQGYNSSIIGQNRYGLYRVCYEGCINRNEAKEKLTAIRREADSSAWLLSI